ncbi:GGDEF domain-containing protein [Candidatus Gracilibacteria bacterium]|nr:GGDEF domain-containing protein [Candidatus Gracilibacteria bacterium]
MKNKINEIRGVYVGKLKEIKSKIKEHSSLYISEGKEIVLDYKDIIYNNRVIFSGLVLFALTHLNSGTINKVYENARFGVNRVLNDNLGLQLEITKQKIIDKIFKETVKEVGTDDINNENLQKALFEKINKYDKVNGTMLLQSLLLGYLYYIAYMKNVRKVRDDYMPVEASSFLSFSLIAGGMTLVNGVTPGSIVYLESFALAGSVVYYHYRNVKNDKKYKYGTIEKMPIPFASYNSKGKPVIWNEKMEQETGYTLKEVLEYYNEHGEIMSLLYKGEELERVKRYLKKVKDEGIGYSKVAFTMTTKSGELKTFLWTTEPNGQGGTNRFAEYLKTKEEIEEELAKTRYLLNEMEEKAMSDKLTGVSNRRALDEDLHNLFIHKLRESDPKNIVLALIDIDDFKKFNEDGGHAAGDKVLKDFSLYMKEARNLRPGDGFYRLGGDEFVIIFENTTTEQIINKLNSIRQDYYNTTGIGTSWGLKYFNVKEFYKKDQTMEETQQIIELIKEEADYYMYSVKYFKCIEEELVARGVIKPGMKEKNGIAYPIFKETENLDGNKIMNLVGAKIVNSYGEFTITKEDLDLIEERKKKKTDEEDKKKLDSEGFMAEIGEERHDEDIVNR